MAEYLLHLFICQRLGPIKNTCYFPLLHNYHLILTLKRIPHLLQVTQLQLNKLLFFFFNLLLFLQYFMIAGLYASDVLILTGGIEVREESVLLHFGRSKLMIGELVKHLLSYNSVYNITRDNNHNGHIQQKFRWLLSHTYPYQKYHSSHEIIAVENQQNLLQVLQTHDRSTLYETRTKYKCINIE